jgi:hypothetical protein
MMFDLLCQLGSKRSDPEVFHQKFMDLSEADWRAFLELASLHGLSGVVFRSLDQYALADLLSPAEAEKLHGAVVRNAARNMLFLREASALLSTLRDRGIDVIGLKGVYLLDNIYEDISVRGMSDLDLLVRKEDIPGALGICQNSGYELTTYFNFADENLDIKHVPPLKKPDGPYVEIHWTILGEDEPFAIDVDGLWGRAVPAKIAGVDVLSLSPEDLLLHLCMHLGYQHQFNVGLRGLYDIAQVLDHFEGQVNWSEFVVLAQEWGAERVMWVTLTLTGALLGSEIPERVLETLRPADAEPWVIPQGQAQLFSRGMTDVPMTPDLAELASGKGLIRRVRVVLSRIFLPRRVLARLYDVPPTSIRIYGCYFRRLCELVRDYGPSVKRIFRRDTETITSARDNQSMMRLKAWMGKD